MEQSSKGGNHRLCCSYGKRAMRRRDRSFIELRFWSKNRPLQRTADAAPNGQDCFLNKKKVVYRSRLS